MAETRDLIVRSNNAAHTKSFIRIGDESPLSVSETGSSLQFLQNLSSSLCTFDTAGTTSAFRIRHDTVNGYLIFEGRSGSNGPYQLMRLNDDTNTVTFGGTVAFEDISFDQITGSHLYVGTSSRLLGTTSISFLSMTSSSGTASICYDASTEGIQFPDGLVIIGSGSAPGVLKFQNQALRIYTHSDVMGNLYVQGLFTAEEGIFAYGNIQAQDTLTGLRLNIFNTASFGGAITSSGAKILGTTSIVYLSLSSSLGVQSVWYDGTYVRIPKLQPIVDTWKVQYKLTGSYNANTYYTIYTDSSQKQIKDYNYLNVYLNGQLLQQSGSNILNWDYATGSNLLPPQIKFHYSLPYNSQDQWWITYVYNGNK